jgi:hypothetical protein
VQGISTRALADLRPVLIVVGLLALLTSALFFSRVHEFYTPDSPAYVVSAGNMAGGHGFVNAEGMPETIRTPGYPLFITPFLWANLDLKYLVLLQHLMRILLILAVTVFCFHASGSRLQALITGIVLCLDLPTLEAANTIMTEVLFSVVFTLALWFLWREAGQQPRSLLPSLLAGLLCSASVLVRPVALLFFVPALAFLLLVRRSFKWRSAPVFLLAFSSLLILWSVRNDRRAGFPGVSSLSGWEMLGFRAAGVLAINDPGNFTSNLERRQKQLEAAACDHLEKQYGKPCVAITMAQKSPYYSKTGAALVLHHPVAYAKLALRGAAMMMLGGDADRLAQFTGTHPETAKKLTLLYTIPLFCFALVGFVALWHTNRNLFYLIFLVIAYFVVVSAGAEGYSRYRVPIMPLYAMAAAAGVDLVVRRVSAAKAAPRVS